MGSAVPRPAGIDRFRTLLSALEEETHRALAADGQVDPFELLRIADEYLDCPDRDEVRRYLVAYISRCLVGDIPVYRRWTPPK